MRRKYRKIGKILLFIILNFCFSLTIIWVAYNNRVRIKKWMDHKNNFSKEDKIILYDIFSGPLIKDEKDLIFPPVNNSDELVKDLVNSTLPDSLDLLNIFDSCTVLSAESYRNNVLRIKYRLYNDTLESFSYFIKTSITGSQHKKAILYTSGTGENKPQKVANRVLDIEDPVEEATQINADIFIPVVPVDDILAIHDGTKMLDIKKISSYLVSTGRSIPLRYLANIFALEKYLRKNYTTLHSWGHSRGSITATIAASIFMPDTLVANSGYAVSLEKFFRLGPDQIWWPHCSAYTDKSSIKKRLCGSATQVYFLFGKKEEDIYGLETQFHYTEKYFKDCSNIKVRYTNQKHVWFSEEVSKILAGK